MRVCVRRVTHLAYHTTLLWRQAKGQVRLQLCFIPSTSNDDPNRNAFADAADAEGADAAHATAGIVESRAALRASGARRRSTGASSGQA